jgi:4-hydroxy-tetrahydrodipicolinate reductase
MKKDRPSGTANKMAQVILEGLGGNKEVSHYEEAMAKRKVDDHSIRICSIREDEVVGDHEIEYRGTGESIKISHHASTRKIFAEGAVRAASWIIDRPAGLYTMEDVLFLKTCA